MIGKSILHYKVLGKLGAGGMGVVYQARDTRLERDVALKFLPPEWSGDHDANRRFMQEARAASGLDHENICTIYEIGETDDGQLFIVMPLYLGETLKYLFKSRRFGWREAVDVACQLLDALARAHQAGIIHRDVKPANIMLTDRGQVKLLDFGIAKLEAGAALTRTGSTLGTAAYMSPEQARGGAVDARSDIWSVGVVLYEMLAGRRPFDADYEQAVLYGIMNETPPSPRELESEIPDAVSSSVMTLLAKSPGDRPADARAAVDLLRSSLPSEKVEPHPVSRSWLRWGVPGVAALIAIILGLVYFATRRTAGPDGSAPGARTVAVLPFTNIRPDPETDFLGFALADEVIGSLAYVSNVVVRPSTSIRRYQGQPVDAKTVGKELSVDYVLAGNYLKEAERMRLTVEMVDVRTNEMIWREPIEVEYSNAFQLQDLVSEQVLNRLKVTFSESERERMRGGIAADPEAYEYYLRAVANPPNQEGNQIAIDLIERSIEIDSTFAPAWNQLGYRLGLAANFGLRGREFAARGRQALEKALQLNPNLLDALGNLSMSRTEAGRNGEGFELANRMLEINPGLALGHFARGYALRYGGMIEKSAAEMRIAISIDSTDSRLRQAAITFYQAGAYGDLERALKADRGVSYRLAWTGMARLATGRRDEGVQYLEEARASDPNGLIGVWATSVLGAATGDKAVGLDACRKLDGTNLNDPESQYHIAAAYCGNGAPKECITLLRESFERGYAGYPALLTEPFFDSVRSNPEFQEVEAMGRANHEAFKAKYFPGDR